jgi:GT2 family glycosyltransferase
VTVVVLNWCRERLTRECLLSLRDTEYEHATILLVDNGSDDVSGERLRSSFPEVSFLQTGSNRGYTGGNNRGIEWALANDSDYVLVLNNDTEVAPGCLTSLVEAAERVGAGVGGVVPKILRHDAPDRIWYAGGEFSPLRGLGLHWREGERDDPDVVEAPRPVTFMTGCCCLLSAKALREVGGFVEELFAYAEDAELSLRFARAGYEMVYEPRARVVHHCGPPGEQPAPFKIRQRDVNRRWVMARYFSVLRRIPFLTRFYATRALLLARFLFTGDLPRARAIISGAFGRVSTPG